MKNINLFQTFILTAILATAALLYVPTIDYSTVWDDHEILVNEPIASGRVDWQLAFSSPVDRLFRPFRTVSFIIDKYFASPPRNHHIVNVALFLITCISLFIFLDILFKDSFISLTATFLYAVHPVHAEAVPWITGGRANLLAAPFVFAALAFHIYARREEVSSTRISLYIFSLLCLTGALLSKESAMVLPGMLFLVEFFFPQEENPEFFSRGFKAFVRSVPMIIITIIFFIYRTSVLGEVGQISSYHGGSLKSTLLSMLPVGVDYLLEIFIPLSPCAVYSPDIFQSFAAGPVALSAAVLLVFFITGVLIMKRAPLISFSIFWFFLTLLPSSNIIPISSMKAIRFLTLPSLAACIIIAALLRFTVNINKSSKTKYLLPIAIAIAIGVGYFSSAANYRNIWKSNFTLWSATIWCAPNSYIVHNNLGLACYNNGNVTKALHAFQRAVDLQPNYPDIRENLGHVYAYKGQYREALEEYKTSVLLRPDNPEAMYKISLLYMKLNRPRDALSWIERALRAPGLTEDYANFLKNNASYLRTLVAKENK